MWEYASAHWYIQLHVTECSVWEDAAMCSTQQHAMLIYHSTLQQHAANNTKWNLRGCMCVWAQMKHMRWKKVRNLWRKPFDDLIHAFWESEGSYGALRKNPFNHTSARPWSGTTASAHSCSTSRNPHEAQRGSGWTSQSSILYYSISMVWIRSASHG